MLLMANIRTSLSARTIKNYGIHIKIVRFLRLSGRRRISKQNYTHIDQQTTMTKRAAQKHTITNTQNICAVHFLYSARASSRPHTHTRRTKTLRQAEATFSSRFVFFDVVCRVAQAKTHDLCCQHLFVSTHTANMGNNFTHNKFLYANGNVGECAT